MFTIWISSCSDDSPEIDNSDQENPDNGNGEENRYTFTIPSDYGSSSNGNRAGGGPGGNGGPGVNSSGNLLISAEGMVSGSSYTIKSGSSSTTATAK